MSGTNRNAPLIAEGPCIILVNPQLGENIGTAARAMANFGLGDLRLVDPRDGWPSESALSASAKAHHIIENTRVYDSLELAVADLSFVYATTARAREMLKPVRGPKQAAAELRRRFVSGQRTGILFGRERWGLKNEEITLADEIVTFPVNPAFASLNIAQAVLLMGYEWLESGDLSALPFGPLDSEPADKADLVGLFEHLETALDRENYFRPPHKKPKMVENLRNIFHKAGLSKQEIRTLRGAVASLEGRKTRPRKPQRNASTVVKDDEIDGSAG